MSRRLHPGRRLVAYDRRGYQRSRDIGDGAPTLDEHVEDLLGVLARSSRPDSDGTGVEVVQPIVLGHSYGGIVALKAVAEHPGVAAALVAYEPPLSWLPWWQDEAHGDPERELVPKAGEEPGEFAERFARTMLGDERYARLSPEIRAGFAADGAAATAELRELATRVPFDPERLGGPITFVRGSATATRHVRASEWLAAAIPGAHHCVIEGASHGGHLSHPADLAAIVEELATQLTRPVARG